MQRFNFILILMLGLSLDASYGQAPMEAAHPEALYVSQYNAEFTKPPQWVPTNWNTDGPILGNGDLGVIMGGSPDKQEYYFSKCDFWRAKPMYPWFTPAFVGEMDLRIPALKMATYHVEQRLDNAEVLQTFVTPETTVTMRSWTPATRNLLLVELSCTGKPVIMEISQATRNGYGSTVQTGQAGDTQWLTRCFSGPEMDWPNEVTMAVRCAGGTCQPEPAAVLPRPETNNYVVQMGRNQKGGGGSGFRGLISDVQVYAWAMGASEVADFSSGKTPAIPPLYSWPLDRVIPGAHSLTVAEGPHGKALRFGGSKDSYLNLGELNIPVHPVTLSAWIYVDKFDEKGANEIFNCGADEEGISLGLKGGILRMGSRNQFTETEEEIPLKRWVHVVGTADGQRVQLYMDGLSINSFPTRVGVEHLTLTPDKPLLVVTAVRTNHESPTYQSEALQMAQAVEADAVEDLRQKHLVWWHNFWSESMVEIGCPLLEKYYYGSFYIMACCSRNPSFPPALFGNQASGDRPWMGGDYHMNYNYQAPWYGCYIANHIGLTDPYDTPLLEFMDHGKMMAHNYLGKKGILFSVGIGPLGSSSDWEKPHNKWEDDSEDKHFFAGQKSNALFCTPNMVMRWRCTYDLDYARKVYPFMLEIANFWEDYLVFDNGRYIDYHDAVQEGSGDDMNAIQTLGMLPPALAATIEMSEALNVDADRRAKWQDIIDKLSPYTFQKVKEINPPDVNQDFLKDPANLEKTVFRYSEKGFPWSPDCTLGIQHIYPGGAFGLDSPPDMLEICRNTVAALGRWDDDNHTMTIFPAAARVGYDPEIILSKLMEECSSPKRGLPNLILNFGGGGIETCSTVTATINEMLLQSHQGTLHLFADWPKNRDARFEKLRAYGAFLVTASQKDGVVGTVTLLSEKGHDCVMANPWPGETAIVTHADGQTEKLEGDRFTFKTIVGETLTLAAGS